MPRILVVTTSFPLDATRQGQAAAGSFVHDFVAALAKEAKVEVVAPGPASEVLNENFFSLRTFRVPRLPLSLIKPTTPRGAWQAWRTMRSGRRETARAVREFKPDHLLALWLLPSGHFARRAAHGKIPYSVWALGSDIWELGKIPPLRLMLRRTAAAAKLVYADGHLLARDVTRITGRECAFLPSSRNLPAPPRVHKTNPPYNLAFLGRFHPNKGADLLMEALGLLSDAAWENIARVRVNGGGPLDEMVRAQGEKLARAGRPVSVGGYLDVAGAAELLGWADYLAIPSRIESIPVIFSDAMQARCPVVSTPVGDLPGLLSKGVGILADSATPEALARAIERAVDGEPAAYGQAIEAMAAEFNVAASARIFLRDAGLAGAGS